MVARPMRGTKTKRGKTTAPAAPVKRGWTRVVSVVVALVAVAVAVAVGVARDSEVVMSRGMSLRRVQAAVIAWWGGTLSYEETSDLSETSEGCEESEKSEEGPIQKEDLEEEPLRPRPLLKGPWKVDETNDVYYAVLRRMYQLLREDASDPLLYELLTETNLATLNSPYGKRQRTLLHVATLQGETNVVERLLARGVDPDVEDQDGRVSLHLVKGRIDLAELLLIHGAYPNIADKNGAFPLHAAVTSGSLPVVQRLLEAYAWPGSLGRSPLHLGAALGDVEIIRELVAKDAFLDAQDEAGRTPLYVAVGRGKEKAAAVLLALGASPNVCGSEDCPLHVATSTDQPRLVSLLLRRNATATEKESSDLTSLHIAALRGFYTVAKALLTQGLDVFDARDGKGMNALQLSVSKGQFLFARFLVERGLELGASMNVSDKWGWSILHWCAAQGHVDMTELFLSLGLAPDPCDGDCVTPLHLAAGYSRHLIVELLCNAGADPNAVDKYGKTPLFIAAAKGSVEVVEVLMGWGADAASVLEVKRPVETDPEDPKSWGEVGAYEVTETTPLHKATSGGSVAVVQKMLTRGASLTSVDEVGRTVLHVSAEKGDNDMLRSLLEHGAATMSIDAFFDLLDAREDNGLSTYLIASIGGNVDTLELLLHFGADVRSVDQYHRSAFYLAIESGNRGVADDLLERGLAGDPFAPDDYGHTALHVAAKAGFTEMIDRLLRMAEDRNRTELLAARTNGGRTPLLYASSEGHVHTVHHLLAAGAPLESWENQRRGPLHWSCRGGHMEVVRLLLEAGANASAQDNWGWSPLHLAISSQEHNISVLLLEYGSNPNVQDQWGWTPLHWCFSGRQIGLAEILLEYGANPTILNKKGVSAMDVAANKRIWALYAKMNTRARRLHRESATVA